MKTSIQEIIEACHEKILRKCGQQRPRSACANAQADEDLRCPLVKSMATNRQADRKERTLIRLGGCAGFRAFVVHIWLKSLSLHC